MTKDRDEEWWNRKPDFTIRLGGTMQQIGAVDSYDESYRLAQLLANYFKQRVEVYPCLEKFALIGILNFEPQ